MTDENKLGFVLWTEDQTWEVVRGTVKEIQDYVLEKEAEALIILEPQVVSTHYTAGCSANLLLNGLEYTDLR